MKFDPLSLKWWQLLLVLLVVMLEGYYLGFVVLVLITGHFVFAGLTIAVWIVLALIACDLLGSERTDWARDIPPKKVMTDMAIIAFAPWAVLGESFVKRN
jgi:hypothetical protein